MKIEWREMLDIDICDEGITTLEEFAQENNLRLTENFLYTNDEKISRNNIQKLKEFIDSFTKSYTHEVEESEEEEAFTQVFITRYKLI